MGSPYKVDKFMQFKWKETLLSDCKLSQIDSKLCHICNMQLNNVSNRF